MATPIKNIIDGFFKKKQEKVYFQKTVSEIIQNVLDEEVQKHVTLKNAQSDYLLFYSDSQVV